MSIEIPISEDERKMIEKPLSEFIHFTRSLPETARVYIYMEFVKRNNEDMRKLKEKYSNDE